MNEKQKIDVIIPTWENDQLFQLSKQSIVNTYVDLRLYKHSNDFNKGWVGFCNEGIKASLENKDTNYILLSNDDIVVSSCDWAQVMVNIMQKYSDIGSLSVLSNKVMGWQRIDGVNMSVEFFRVPYISHFFVLLRKDVIRKIGLLDESLPGGDDLDYSFRINEAGYMTAVTPKVFVWHHYAVTGKKLYGEYWDSEKHSDNINKALIDKHGFKRYVYGITGYEKETKQ